MFSVCFDSSSSVLGTVVMLHCNPLNKQLRNLALQAQDTSVVAELEADQVAQVAGAT
jgi:hypothetical protein